ncbi:kinase superfamily with octicosapeptide/Phox/Bem1p domain-containing protein [Perilla frutescens var. hirtella]|nr:kinase superfamily with octicosapeptide/Phox/Bem1p domain-containing protein [Perilla frutescens var. frutescens]KAH6794461.1 kinase superfamily with octicosapeptide/Phox/Bem1p domain-containing protein [Perilla frutescens var. hirtella]
MDSPIVITGSALSTNDENQPVKFLCSFSGSILPRPQDGKLRYVGGETRIVSVPRDITYEELMGKMRELYEGVTVLKYQQPDEDLDALVSVVNDDDVTNMMEEYDKLGMGDGFTRLRIFLFAHPDQDGSLYFGEGDERDNARRYVDALNSLNESPDSRNQLGESLVVGSLDDVQAVEQYFNQMNLEGSVHGQRNMELPMAQMNLRHLTIPHLGSGQLQQAVNQRYNEMEVPWSPVYYSPRQPVDQRPVAEFPTSPSSSRYRTPYGENFDRLPEDYNRPPMSTHSIYDQQLQYTDNVLLFPAGSAVNEKIGSIDNILQGSNAFEGNSICEQCLMPYQRNQVNPDSSWKPGEQPHLEPPNMGNGYLQVPHSCAAECPPNREIYMLSSDGNLNPSYYCREPNDPRPVYSETRGHERGWISPHQSSPWAEEPRPHLSVSGSGRLSDSYIVENGMNIPLGHSNVCDGHHVQSQYMHHEDQRYARPRADYGSQVFQDQATATGSQVHLPSADDRGVRFGNPPYAYGADNAYQVPHGHIPTQPLWRNVHSPLPGGPSYETSASSQLVNGSVPMNFIRGALEGSPTVRTGLENQNPWPESSQKVAGYDGSLMSDFSHIQAVKFPPSTYTLENKHPCNVEPAQSAALLAKPVTSKDSFTKSDPALPFDDTSVTVNVAASGIDSRSDSETHKSVIMNENGTYEGSKEKNNGGMAKDSGVCVSIDRKLDALASSTIISPVVPKIAVENCVAVNGDETNVGALELQDDRLEEFLPELIASVKEATLQSLKEVKAKVREGSDLGSERDTNMKEDAQNHKDGVDGNMELEVDSDNDNVDHSKIELTKAEAEALDRGLQTIRNEDLEEIRELGSGTYGAVYHGKWKGSDVAIKRIKASCFAGRPSERERLIADFWKEALILSSLHHPNVVSFYGVVRDGPDGSLATVTEFMVNGSLKQFLQKKDRTIDRRKRLIIAMDTAFGMEYLHGKNIVHFDLKCENLLVNMRDPHRPVCKVKQNTLVSGGVRGTLPWMAPELLSGKSNMVTEKIDVYSFGIVMWELLTGDEPYTDMHCASIIGGIVNNSLRPQIPMWCDPEWKSLMESCWGCDPAERPSFSEIAQRLRNMAAAMNLK